MRTEQEAVAKTQPRSIDFFFEEAYRSHGKECCRLRYWLIFLAMGMANLGDAAEFVAIGFLISNKEFQDGILRQDMAHNGAIVASVVMIGLTLGGLATGTFELHLGRKSFLLLGLTINYISCLVSAFAPNVFTFATARFVAGFGIGVICSSVTSLSTELSPPSRRGFFVSFVGSFWSVGMIFAALAGFLALGIYHVSWRIFLVISATPNALSFFMVLFLVPESARFLVIRGKYSDAASAANLTAECMGHRSKELSTQEVHHHQMRIATTDKKDPLINGNEDFETQQALGDDVRMGDNIVFREIIAAPLSLFSIELKKKTIFLIFLWIFLEVGGGLSPWINTIFERAGANQYLGAFFVAVGNGVGNVLGITLVDRVGRVPLLMGSIALSSLSLAVFSWLVHVDPGHSMELVSSACLYSTFIASAWTANIVMTGEMFPTTVRNAGFGVCAAVGRLAFVCTQFIHGAFVGQPAILLVASSAAMGIGLLILLSFKVEDMSRRPLSDTISSGKPFDNETFQLDKLATAGTSDVKGTLDLPTIMSEPIPSNSRKTLRTMDSQNQNVNSCYHLDNEVV